MDDLQTKLDRANAMLQLLQNQRNTAQNECVALGVELIAAQKRIAELEGAAKEITDCAKPQAKNGHAEARS